MQKGREQEMNNPVLTVQRRLAAIFCADVAAYTLLMNADEAGTLRLLSSHREMTDQTGVVDPERESGFARDRGRWSYIRPFGPGGLHHRYMRTDL